MQPGVCHSCRLSTAVFGPDAFCPLVIPGANDTNATWSPGNSPSRDALLGYGFGRFLCNPPPRLMRSLINFLQTHNPNPDAIIITGDLAPHGYPDDNYPVQADTQLNDLCPTKYIGTSRTRRDACRICAIEI